MRKPIRIRSRAGAGVAAALALVVVTSGLTGGANAGAADGDVESSRRSCWAEQAELSALPDRIVAAWGDNDADALAAAFTRDATFIVPGDEGVYLHSRDEIRSYMAGLFDGPVRGTTLKIRHDPVRCLSRDVGIAYTVGGMLMPGQTEVPAERVGAQSFVVVRQNGEWLVTAYQNARIAGLQP